MATRDFVNNVRETVGLAPATRTATALSAKCDMQGYESVMVKVHIGTFGDSQSGSVYLEAELQESDDNVTYAACADSALLLLNSPPARTALTGTATGTFVQTKTTGGADVAGVYVVGYRGYKRYIKVNLRLTGSHSSGTITSVTFTQSNPNFTPSI